MYLHLGVYRLQVADQRKREQMAGVTARSVERVLTKSRNLDIVPTTAHLHSMTTAADARIRQAKIVAMIW